MPDPSVDLVLLFECAPSHALEAGAQPDAAADRAIAAEYARLVSAIRSVGMRFTARPGADKGTVLLFVKAEAEALVHMRRAENMKDFLHGAGGPPGPGSASQPFSPAERIRFTHALLTSPASAEASQPSGAGLAIKSSAYPHLLDIFPVHDTEYNRVWLERWTKLGSLLTIKDGDLDDLRAQFGEHVAVYFAFLASYFTSLLFLAPIAVSFWYSGCVFSLSYSILLVAWSLIFTEVWRMRERKLSVRWGTYGTEAVAERRQDFQPRTVKVDEATGEKEEVFEWWRRESRMAVSLPVMLFFAALLGATLTTMFAVEVFATKLYDGVGAALLPQVPTILFATAVPQIMGAWQATAKALTKWENHYSAQNHADALTLKTFALQAFVSYGALTLSALVYIPFGQSIMNELVSRGYFAGHISRALARGTLHHTPSGEVAFDINAARMHNQLFAVLTTTQAIGAFTELVLPFILRKVAEYRKQRAEGGKTGKSQDKFLQRVAKEMALPPYETFGDYAEMATQFGYIVLWSTIWPLAPIMALVNNFFELRSDALKVCLNSRRPVPRRSATIGPWLDVLSFIAWLAALSNAALVYLFQQAPDAHLEGHSVYETKMRTHHADITTTSASGLSERYCPLVPSFLPCSSAASALVAGLLLALVAERGYSVLRSAVRHLLERALWRGSAEETQLRRRDWQARQMAVAQHGISAPTPMPPALPDKEGSADGAFWDAEADESSNSIAGVQKRE